VGGDARTRPTTLDGAPELIHRGAGDNVPNEPRDISRDLSDLIEKRSRRFKWANRFVKVLLIAIGSALATALQFAQTTDQQGLTRVQWSGIIVSILVCIGAVYLLIVDEDASTELAAARRATEKVRDKEEELRERERELDDARRDHALQEFLYGTLNEDLQSALKLYQSMAEMRRVLERSVASGASLSAIISAFNTTTARTLRIALQFEQADRWTVCVYQARPIEGDPSRSELSCVAHNRAIDCDVREARTFPEGVGGAGLAFLRNHEVIVPDLLAEGLESVFDLREHSKSYDADRYRSIAAVPVQVDGRSRPWGVVVATNDREGHFTTDVEEGFDTSEPVRMFAGMIALAVAIFDKGDDPDGKAPPVALL
jgi:hypothetical protein